MKPYQEIVEPEPPTHAEKCLDVQAKRLEAHRRGEGPPWPRGKATIIQTAKCKRLHFNGVWIFLGALAAGALALGASALFLIAMKL